MSDIGLFWDVTFADFDVSGQDLVADEGLETAISLSLFTDRRAEEGDILPDQDPDRRGWWGDNVPVVPGDKFGSRLWLLRRSKNTPETIARAEEYARESLQWLLDDKVTTDLSVVATAAAPTIMLLSVTALRPKSGSMNFKFSYNWASQEAKRV